MANEIKNRQHAIAMVAPVPAAPFTTPIVSSVGVSGFVRNGPGNYTVALNEAAPFHTTRTSASLGANVLGTIGAQLAPGGASVLVTAFDPLGVPFDPQYFDLAVDTIRDGEGVGPAPALPAVPAPPSFGGGGLLGFSTIAANGAIERNGGMLTSVLGGAGSYQLFLTPAADGSGVSGDPNISISVIPRVSVTSEPLAVYATYVGPNPGAWQVSFKDTAGAVTGCKFSVQFFKLP